MCWWLHSQLTFCALCRTRALALHLWCPSACLRLWRGCLTSFAILRDIATPAVLCLCQWQEGHVISIVRLRPQGVLVPKSSNPNRHDVCLPAFRNSGQKCPQENVLQPDDTRARSAVECVGLSIPETVSSSPRMPLNMPAICDEHSAVQESPSTLPLGSPTHHALSYIPTLVQSYTIQGLCVVIEANRSHNLFSLCGMLTPRSVVGLYDKLP